MSWKRCLPNRFKVQYNENLSTFKHNKCVYTCLNEFFNEHNAIRCKKCIIHIGAHKCEELDIYTQFTDNILWIDANDELCLQNKSIVNALISDQDDLLVDFIITDNDAMSSSILEMNLHKEEHPDCLEVSRLKKKTVTLDTLFDRLNMRHDTYDMLCIDIQGAELLALKGSLKILPHINCIITEVNTKELYTNCPLIQDLDNFLMNHGFYRAKTCMTRHGWGDAAYIRKTVSVCLSGGLGNRLFQLAFLYSIAKKTNSIPVLYSKHILENKHSSINYFPFYQYFPILENILENIQIIQEPSDSPAVFFSKVFDITNDMNHHNFLFQGYFQSERYFESYSDDIKTLFIDALEKISPSLQFVTSTFVHIRGGDHIHSNNREHSLSGIEKYYKNSIQCFPKHTVFTILTDDVRYAKSLSFLKDIKYSINTFSNELSTINLMRSATIGGICSNSTFSWWGAYLNRNILKIVTMPYPFLNYMKFSDIYFKGTIIIPIEGSKTWFDSICSCRQCEDEIIIVMVATDLTYDKITECFIDDKEATLFLVDKAIHQDNYNDLVIITCKYANTTEELLRLTINGKSKHIVIDKMDCLQKYNLVMMTMFKHDNLLIESFITYYTKIHKIEHYFLYYNGDECTYKTLPEFSNVTYIFWPYPYFLNNMHYAQFAAINDFLYFSKHITKLALYNDLDEYISWKTSETLSEFLLQNDYDCYGFLNRFICLQNMKQQIFPSPDIYKMIENKTYQVSKTEWKFGERSKCIIKVSKVQCMGVHKVILPHTLSLFICHEGLSTLLHICNIVSRTNISLDVRCKNLLFLF